MIKLVWSSISDSNIGTYHRVLEPILDVAVLCMYVCLVLKMFASPVSSWLLSDTAPLERLPRWP